MTRSLPRMTRGSMSSPTGEAADAAVGGGSVGNGRRFGCDAAAAGGAGITSGMADAAGSVAAGTVMADGGGCAGICACTLRPSATASTTAAKSRNGVMGAKAAGVLLF